MRPHRPLWFMRHAFLQAERATCFRLNVGCVIVDQSSKRIVSSGYNGPGAGQPHCSGHVCPGVDHCRISVHAEINACDALPALVAREYHIAPRDAYCTHSPCKECTERMAMLGIDRIFFCHEYRKTEHLAKYRVNFSGIYKVTPAGYITPFDNNTLIPPESLYD